MSGRDPEQPPQDEESSDRESQSRCASRCFPIQPFLYCPGPVKLVLPGTWQKIQDGTHLTLVFGVLSCFGLIVQTIVALSHGSTQTYFAREVFVVMFILPFTTYCMKIIAQYDDRLVSKQQHAKDQRNKLTQSYNELIANMDGLLTKSAESSAGLAERSFESKRRDFQRFLERVRQRYSTVYSSSKGDYEKLIAEFRRFCLNWLHVFEECSIDPTQNPKIVVTEEQLLQCSTIAEIADLCLERLRVTEVRFISMQREQDQKMISSNKTAFTRITAKIPKGTKKLALMSGRTVETAVKKRTTVGWLSVGKGSGCSCQCRNPESEDGFPRTFGCVCMSLTILSKEHLLLIFAFWFGWITLAMEIFHMGAAKRQVDQGSHMMHAFGVAMAFVTQFSLIVMLIRFEQVDVLQQLEREVKTLAKQNEAVEGQSARMREFWSNCQQLTELWLYRTVPRLDLYKEIHSQLEDAPPEDLLVNIQGANDQLQTLEKSLGPLEDWRKDGGLKTDSKKEFGRKINQLCQEPDFSTVLHSLEEITASSTGALRAIAPDKSEPPIETLR
mmetsp:Transcript_80029/g.212019  ORF Transcript_80029/g.212019 Transcript_80029/m.212019 type:complete len:556 (-) Transcript_80029:170-1837(-)